MGNSDHRTSVGDYVTLVRGTTYSGALVGRPGPALLGLGSIEPGGGFRIGNYKSYGGDCPIELMLFPGDLYASLKGATKDGKMIGSVARVPLSVPTGRLTQDTVKLIFKDPNAEDASYLHWILRTPQYREYCSGHAMGSAVVALSRRDFLTYPVPSPTEERRVAVALLDAIEARVELNRRMNETLEAMARALFKSWFVDFDPVRAKAEGREAGLPVRLAELFPIDFDECDSGQIPAGWQVRSVSQFAFMNPESWSKQTHPAAIKYVDLSNTKWGRIEDATDYRWEVAPSRAQRVLRTGDSIVGMVRPGNGSYALVSESGLTGSTGFAVLRPRKPHFTEFVYLAITAADSIEALARLADGAAYPAVRPETVAATQVIGASDQILEAFSGIARPILAKIFANDSESRTLAALRDTLLPKLISGELRVKTAEKIVEAVA